jgi:plastocyanin
VVYIPISNLDQTIGWAYAATSQIITIPKFATTKDHFQPQTIIVEKGTTVRWNNEDFLLHTVTSGTLKSGNSGVDRYSSYIIPGQSFEHQFNKLGHFKYFCALHSSDAAEVIVKNKVPSLNGPDRGPTLR